MTLLEIVNQLQKQGYQVKYTVRSDGGILIREINGQRYTGATGNAVARKIVGATLSERRSIQLQRATKQRKWQRKPIKEPTSAEELRKYMRRVQRKWRKNVDVNKAGQITWRKLQKIAAEEGVEAAYTKLRELEKYSEGIAYSEVVEALISYIEEASRKLGNPKELIQLVNDIRNNIDKIKDEWIKPAYDSLYSINSENYKDLVNQVRSILRL